MTLIVKMIYSYSDEVVMLIFVSDNLKKLAKIFPVDLYIVGGYVRNQIMGLPKTDVDLCGQLKLEEVSSLLQGSMFSFKVKNKALGTGVICDGNEEYEYSCFREEEYAEGGERTPTKVNFIKDVKQDAKRRDFTCNSLYYDIKKDKILDFYGGIEDIKHKILKTVETPEFVLSHDGLRILRLFRFQCELGFKIDKETLNVAIKYAYNAKEISGERVVYEITRILHSYKRYPGYSKPNAFMKAFKLFNKASLWPAFGLDTPKIKLRMVKKVEHKSQGFLIDLVDTVEPISISYYLNLVLSQNFGVNKKLASQIINILSGYYDALNRLDNKNYFFKYFENFEQIYLLLSHKSKYLAMKYNFFYRYIISHKLVISLKELKISGDDIKSRYPKVNPKRYKAILESLLSDVFDGKLPNNKKDLIMAVEGKLKYL